jgi:hypothetical protein
MPRVLNGLLSNYSGQFGNTSYRDGDSNEISNPVYLVCKGLCKIYSRQSRLKQALYIVTVRCHSSGLKLRVCNIETSNR